MVDKNVSQRRVQLLLSAARRLNAELGRMQFSPPVTHVYNPLSYAWAPYELYLRRFATGPKRVVFLGMNPGPFGMVQTGVPFGEIAAVREWLQIEAPVTKPSPEHPRRPVSGFSCPRSEVSGRRLWGLFTSRFGTPDAFFAEHIVMNFCPLAFIEESGRNRTPDKLPGPERELLLAACQAHLRSVLSVLEPEWLVGIGDFAFRQAELASPFPGLKRGRILHPSPASPAANRDWTTAATRQLTGSGIWPAEAAARREGFRPGNS